MWPRISSSWGASPIRRRWPSKTPGSTRNWNRRRRGALSRFFPPSVLGPVLQTRDFGLVPQDLEVSVLFSDISGFTAMSSTMPPREVVGILNRYLPVMAGIVFKHEGTLEKYIGDALMAIWGAPVCQEDDADR